MEHQVKMDKVPYDFSCKHDILLQNEDGTLQPMDVPYFRNELIAPGTWLIRSDGDFSYLLEGEREAILIDSGYGCGDIRGYCQSLLGVPLHKIANTHCHFDHTANNGRFDLVYMSREAYPEATVPFPSFDGIYFPKDYKVEFVTDGFVIDLGGRTLEVLETPDHSAGGTLYLDRNTGILFSGDEFMSFGKQLNGTVEHWYNCLKKLAPWEDAFDVLYGGVGRLDKGVIDKMRTGCRRILNGEEGMPYRKKENGFHYLPDPEGLGRTVIARYLPRPSDAGRHGSIDTSTWRELDQDGFLITYDSQKIFDIQ